MLIEEFTAAVRDAIARLMPFGERVDILRAFRDRGLTAKQAEEALQQMRGGTDGESEDQILELLDIAVGWCGPGVRVWSIVDETLLKDLKHAVRRSVEELSPTTLAGYSLRTDDDVGSVFGMAVTEEEVAEANEEDLLFTPSEWPHELHGDLFNEISRALFRRAPERREHVRESFETLVEALSQLRTDGLFAQSVFLSAGSTDPGPYLDALEAGSVRRLNDQSLVDARERFLAKWAPQPQDEIDEAARIKKLRDALVRLHASRESLPDPVAAIEMLYAEHDYPRELHHLVGYEPGPPALRPGETPTQGLLRALEEYVQMIGFSGAIERLLEQRAPSSELVFTLREFRARGLPSKLAESELERLRACAIDDAVETKLLELIARL
jgi:hypothetical protein